METDSLNPLENCRHIIIRHGQMLKVIISTHFNFIMMKIMMVVGQLQLQGIWLQLVILNGPVIIVIMLVLVIQAVIKAIITCSLIYPAIFGSVPLNLFFSRCKRKCMAVNCYAPDYCLYCLWLHYDCDYQHCQYKRLAANL